MLINLTSHTVNEVTTGVAIPMSGRVARAKTKTVRDNEFCGFPIFKSIVHTIEGLPEPKEGVMYIVSSLVLSACPDRKDLLAPGNVLKDENNRPVGCVGFRSNM